MSFNIYWKASTKQVVVNKTGDTAPAGYALLDTVTHDAEGDTRGAPGSHVIYHEVRDALYHEGVLDMTIVEIVAFDQIIDVSALSVAPADVTLSLAGTTTQQLTLTFIPAAPDDTTVSYYSSDPTIATVSSSGLVTAVSEGVCIITAVYNIDGYFTDTCVVTVGRVMN